MSEILVGASWSAENDIELNKMKAKHIKLLAGYFKRSDGAIRSRLKHLSNPEHPAYQRLYGTSTSGAQSFGKINAESQPQKKRKVEININDSIVEDYKRGSFSNSDNNDSIFAITELNVVPLISVESLTLSQRDVAERVIDTSENIFLTGAAGVGKSYLLRYIIEQLKLKYPAMGAVAVTAPTGIAALHIQGQTIHSFAGIGLGRNTKENLFAKMSLVSRSRWAKCQVLVIDEMSMVDSQLFDKLDFIARGCRESQQSLPFGGIKLVLSGDFFQLPPVGLGTYGLKFPFDSVSWVAANIATLYLTQIVRQQDTFFMNLLNEVRVGICSPQTTAVLAACHKSLKRVPNDGILPTKLYCTNANVDEENLMQLAALPGQQQDFSGIDMWQSEPSDADQRKQVLSMMEKKCPAVLPLKVGAQVMLSRNMPEFGLVNGSRGVVVSFVEEKVDSVAVLDSTKTLTLPIDRTYIFPVVQFDNDRTMKMKHQAVWASGQGRNGSLVRIQFPLKLAWALTVHKSQGMTLSRVEVQLGNAFDFGQVYVALSRVVSLAGLYVQGTGITQSIVKAHPDVLRFYKL
mmetsp:Transcript_10593/g.15931  ORF Transcript_10593/g.15931 Transcript_10593/m.15931 type:complete len:573 (-) Transcript_10593:499-2217(-)